MHDFRDLVSSVYEDGDAAQRVLFGKYVEELRIRSANNKNTNAAVELGVSERTFQRILSGQNVRFSSRENLPDVLSRFCNSIDDGSPVLAFDEWVQTRGRVTPTAKNDGYENRVGLESASAISKRTLARLSTISFRTKIVGIGMLLAAFGGAISYSLKPDPETKLASPPSNALEAPSASLETRRVTPELEEIDLLKITKSGERRRSEHHPPKAQFTVWDGRLFLKDLTLPNGNPILSVAYSRFGESFTPFDPSDDQLDRSLAPVGPFLVNTTYRVGDSSVLKEYDLTTQRDYHLKTAALGFDATVKPETINRHVSCVENVCAVQRSVSNNALCFAPARGGRLISGFEVYELDRQLCKSDAPLPICLNEEQLGFELGREARVVFEVDLIDGTSRRYDVSPRSEGVLLPSGDFVSLDAMGGALVHQCE